ncbi:hypothetical protein [Mycolicibacterium llatzerense]|uniref:hypothetical protein n=1 Tax=Mycolicibacterium llatzerense TaxID=280871 RepID=UPI0008DD2A3F|nr:hypothetical protein [Mycolicibacterium llatzerense]
MTESTVVGVETLIDRQGWLRVSRSAGEIYVYRSVQLPENHRWMQPALSIVGDAEPVRCETIEDPAMWLARAELKVYNIGGEGDRVDGDHRAA